MDAVLDASAVNFPPERRVKATGPRRGINRVSPLSQALDLKAKAYAAALADNTPIHIQAAFMRAWVDLHEITMAIRGQGKPKPIEARNAPKRESRGTTAPIVATPPANGSTT